LGYGFITFPIAFLATCLNATANITSSIIATPSAEGSFAIIKSVSLTQINVFAATNVSATYTHGLYRMAKGY